MLRILRRIEKGLCALFLISLLVAFNAPVIASMIVFSILMHELGHAISLCLLKKLRGKIRISTAGLSMPYRGILSYKEELLVASAGPLMNLTCALICLILCPLGRTFFLVFALLHLLYALSNLLPLPRYDGEKILGTLLALRYGDTVRRRVCRAIEFTLRSLLLFISLLFMLVLNAAYHVFFVFFLSWLSMLNKGLCGDNY